MKPLPEPCQHPAYLAGTGYFADLQTVDIYGKAVSRVGLWRAETLLFENYFLKSGCFLDLGCGAGRVAIGLWRVGYQNICGVDLSPTMIAEARNISASMGLPIVFKEGDACDLAFSDGLFDGVIFGFNGLMQIPYHSKRRKAMQEVFRVLKPGGVFIFTTHDRAYSRSVNWAEEAQRWADGLQNPDLIDFGDTLYPTPSGTVFIHIPSQEAILADLGLVGFKLLKTAFRSEIAYEQAMVRDFADECRFWVVQK